ncbi:MAG TPA: RNA polymerase sigma factor [Clostridiales bacterium]|nr:RNA polymerase sigma factor [Clostridiales bacterium]
MTEFEEIYCQYFTDVYKYALSLTRNEALAEEITQETFFKALKAIDNFKGQCKLRVWLCQIARNTYFSLYKRKKHITNKPYMDFDSEWFEQKLIDSETVMDLPWQLKRVVYKKMFSMCITQIPSGPGISQNRKKTTTSTNSPSETERWLV